MLGRLAKTPWSRSSSPERSATTWSGPAIKPVAVAPVETDPVTALERLDAEFEEVQRRRKAALEDLLRVQEAELAKTLEVEYGM